ncbi:MAG: hypothetical protein ACE5GA_11535, partial [Candidatus Zixiibacteriota bacterium]
MNRSQKRHALLIGAIASVCLLFSLLVIRPLDNRRKVLKAETAEHDARLLDYQTTMLTINTYLEKRRELESRRASLSAGL